jgi:hypothetical protein
MASNLFGQPSKNDIRVGYIDPKLGYVNDVTICDANEYAKENPGTTFLFKDGNKVLRYININEVNSLTPQELETNQECDGLNQKKECGPPSIQIYGGGGIGAVGNPVIGIDGSLLAVDLVSGGYGYQYPPQVSANDNCNYGSGSVLTAVIGEVVDGFETYTDVTDFEEYEICDPNDAGFGRRYGPNGEDLGPWEPNAYTKIGIDPIRTEIEKYEKGVRAAERKPFWSTRRNRPTKITASDPRVTTTQAYKVSFGDSWSEFMNSYAVSPVPPSNVKGSDYAATLFTMEWNEEFPTTGEYIFRGLCDNIAQLYIDNEKLFDLGGFKGPVNDIRKTIKEGIHNIRVDLLNAPIKEKVTSQLPSGLVDVSFTVYGEGKRTEKLKFSFVSEDGSHSFVLLGNKKSKESRNETVKVRPNTKYKVAAVSTFAETEQGIIQNGKKNKEGGIGSSNKIFADHIGSANDNDDIQITAGSGKFQSKNKRTAKNSGRSTYDLTFFIEGSVDTTSSTASNSTIQTKKIFNTVDYINKANRKLWRTNVYGRGGFINEQGVCPFDTSVQLKDNPYAGTHRIVWDNIDFPFDGSYSIDIEVDDNVKLTFSGSKGDIIISKKGFSSPSKGTGKTTETRFFKAGKYKIIADLEQIPGGKFGFAEGKNINPMALAVEVSVATTTQEVISPKSWNENPMGISVTIDAPEPTVPQEPVPAQEGRCPNNPIWTTRFPTKTEKWYPVKFPGPRTITEIVTTNVATPTLEKKEVEFSVYGQGAFRDLSFVFTAVDGSHTFTLYGVDKNKKTRKDKVQIKPNINYIVVAKEDSTKFSSVEQGLIKGGTKAKENGIGTSNKIFADYIKSGNDNDDIQIAAAVGTFTSSNKRKAKNSGRSTYDLVYRFDAAPTTKNSTTTSTRTFDAPGWSRFMNRYAISPVKPLDTPGSDKAGATYSTSWDIDIPYDGFYGVKGTRDNTGRILIDNNEVSKLDGFNVDDPKLVKTFITKGRHTITAEVYNTPIVTENTIDQKIFGTKDWQVAGISSTSTSVNQGNIKPKFIQKNGKYYLEVTGSGSGEIEFVMEVDDAPYIAGLAAKEVILPSDGNKISFKRSVPSFPAGTTNDPNILRIQESAIPQKETIKKSGKFTAGKTYGPIEIIGANLGAGTPRVSNNKLGLLDADGTDENIKLIITDTKSTSTTSTSTSITGGYLSSGTVKDGITYEGPSLFHYSDSRWGEFMNNHSVSPYLPPFDVANPKINGTKKYTWKGVKFPESGQYRIAFQADNIGSLYIGGTKVLTTTSFKDTPTFENVNISAGTYDVIVEVENIKDRTDVFNNNPTGFGVVIRKDVTIRDQNKTPWSSNPMGISAILIPPPCPKKLSGKGVVKKVVIQDPGNGYLPPSGEGSYPAGLRLREVIVENPGINYNCGVDQIQITPSNGAVLDYVCDSFGKIKEVKVLNPGLGFTEYPQIQMVSPPGAVPTGINASFRPQFEVVRDPIVTVPEKLIQVTDLVGLKQNGYVDGRAYYGSVFYKDGVRYAGFYETPGELVQVYDTLQDSINAQVTTAASAIERSGTDTELSSNNPKLNIPGTPENLI